MKNTLFTLITPLLFSFLFSCTAGPVSDEVCNNDETTILRNQVVMRPDGFSVYGQWSIGIKAIYTDGGEEFIDSVPPGAISPIVQTHYLRLDPDAGAQHLICVSPIGEGVNTTSFGNVFLGDDRTFIWDQENNEVLTDLSSGLNQTCKLYTMQDGSFGLRFEGENLTYDPFLVFSRIEDDEWDEAFALAMTKGTQIYEDKLTEYQAFYKDILGYESPFKLCQFFEW